MTPSKGSATKQPVLTYPLGRRTRSFVVGTSNESLGIMALDASLLTKGGGGQDKVRDSQQDTGLVSWVVETREMRGFPK